MSVATLSRKEVKTKLNASDYILNKLLQDAKCQDVIQEPKRRIFPARSWQPLFDFIGIDIDNQNR